MEKIIAYIICGIIIFSCIKGSIKASIYEGNLRYSMNRMLYYFSVFLSFIIITSNLDKIITFILNLNKIYMNSVAKNEEIFRIGLLVIIYFIFQFIIYHILKLISRVLCLQKDIRIRSNGILVFFSAIFGTIKGLTIVLITFVAIITFNSTWGKFTSVNIFNDIQGYNNLQKIVDDKNKNIDYDKYKDLLPASNVIVYYNGVTLEEGISTTNEIDNKALEIINNCKSDREKARALYVWIGSNIKYDFNKAERALNNEAIGNSGAKEAWLTRKGICFDYACLYVAMARKVDLRVRLITGSAFDGRQYGPHAWNEVYLEDEGKWINVDPTFYEAGNYFDNKNFFEDHIIEEVIGEW